MNLRFMLIWFTWFAVTAALVAASHRQRGDMQWRTWMFLWQQTFVWAMIVFVISGLYRTTQEKRAKATANSGPALFTIDGDNGIKIYGKEPHELQAVKSDGFIIYGAPPERSRNE